MPADRIPPHSSTDDPLRPESAGRAKLEDRFEFLEQLGSGAAGTVYRARALRAIGEWVAEGDTVAVKLLRADKSQDRAARAQLAREAAIGETVDSPFVIQIYAADGFDEDEVPAHLVMEYVQGRTLRTFLEENGPTQGALARRIGEHAARGLAALHELGIVHRDLKPENLLWTDASELKVMDLGLARVDERPSSGGSGTASDGFHGSFAYAAPEVLRGRPHTASADLYALGLLLFEVTTGRHPFVEPGQSPNSPDLMIHAHLETPAPRASHFAPRISTLLDVLLDELLEKNPARRLGPALEVARALELGEKSNYWRRHEQFAPVLASRRRLQVLRRNPVGAFVDRTAERRVLDAALRRARRSREGSVIHVTGSAGVGRRRLCDEWVAGRLEKNHSPLFLGGKAERRSTEHPAAPFPEILIDYFLRGESADAPRAEARIRTRVAQELGWEDADAALLAEVVCTRHPEVGVATQTEILVRATLGILDRHSHSILRIDRASRLHGPSAQVARAISDRVASRSVVYLLVGRSCPIEDVTTLHLRGLPEDAFLQLGASLFADPVEAPFALLRNAWQTLAGNPRALIASLEELESDGQLHGRPGSYQGLAIGISELRPARTMVARLKQRIVELPSGPRFVLQAAAVLGREFRLDDLETLTGRPELELLEAIGSFDGRVAHAVQGEGTFAHRDYRRALLASIAPGQRRRMHRAAAWLLEDRGAEPLEIGMHYSRAMLDEECVPLLVEGAARLIAAGRRRGALRILERARLHVSRLEQGGRKHAARARIDLLHGQTLSAIGEPTRARTVFRESIELAEQVGDLATKAAATLGLAELEQQSGHFLAAIQLFSQIEDIEPEQAAENDELRATIARAYGVHSQALAFQGQTDDALELIRAGLSEAPPGDDRLRAHLEIDRARWLALHTRFTLAHRAFVRAADRVDASGDTAASMRLLLHGGRFENWLGAHEDGVAKIRDCIELADQVDDGRIYCRAHAILGELYAFGVDDSPALAEGLVEAERVAKHVDDRVTAAMARAMQVLGGAEVQPTSEDAVGVPLVDVLWAFAGATRARRSEEFELAREYLEQAMRIAEQVRVPLPLRIALLRAAGRESAARKLPENVLGRLPRGFSKRRFLRSAARWRVR